MAILPAGENREDNKFGALLSEERRAFLFGALKRSLPTMKNK
jgi:hypothetical protein